MIIRGVNGGVRHSLQPFTELERCHGLRNSRVVNSVVHRVSRLGRRSTCTCFFQQSIGCGRRPRTLSFTGLVVSADTPHARVSSGSRQYTQVNKQFIVRRRKPRPPFGVPECRHFTASRVCDGWFAFLRSPSGPIRRNRISCESPERLLAEDLNPANGRRSRSQQMFSATRPQGLIAEIRPSHP